ncbi:hypothetical protein PR048_001697 [Dryococelus australis]|uniref:CCHC-type domain-containing protein n=1 Tax=Dryococelus australis TaxID=614101 RepID=A0ABQ9II32_9NEOP|nr:hypothetical protein PR048_001697 [Dryococelus australis]
MNKTTAKELMDIWILPISRREPADKLILKSRNFKFTEGSSKEFINVFENTINKLKSSGGRISNAEIITLPFSSMPKSYNAVMRAIDISFSKHPENIDLNHKNNGKVIKQVMKKEKACLSSRWKNKDVNDSGNKTQANVPFRFNCYSCGCKGHKKSECKFSLRRRNISSTSDHQRCEPDGGTTFVAVNRDQNVNKQCLVSNSSSISFVMDS